MPEPGWGRSDKKSDQTSEIREKKKIADVLNDLIDDGFYGTVTLTLKAGKFIHMKKEESIKLS